jgi:hypothetical protein
VGTYTVEPQYRRSAVTGLILFSLAAPAAQSQSAGSEREASIDDLKRAYLLCDREALGGRLTNGAIMQCSIVYEELMRRAFGGHFDKLLAWSRAQTPHEDARQRVRR